MPKFPLVRLDAKLGLPDEWTRVIFLKFGTNSLNQSQLQYLQQSRRRSLRQR